ncbi:DUF3131 domain-containing protein [Pseudoroseicyclus aestuarii]|uniref:Uncharacterized protein DUF3131 n=1 Tax=Pseudoroseicyclus aestuarii TaxID=1795041 RepID=A0A318SX54_9RHOB|nr:DUF3131 domain-containing protein [Pseudoroseicyclus aestuarii]PYE85992.1 uncharacterized protein DUF3131 [Pseudoroseicyclus aestuarii]
MATSPFSLKPSLLFLAGLGLATSFAIAADGAGRVGARTMAAMDFTAAPDLAPLPPRALTAADRQAAEAAWGYMTANTDPETGFVGSVEGFPSATMWDQASYLLGVVAAERLEVIDDGERAWRIERFLTSLADLPLVDGQLPNKAYDTRTLAMVNYDNSPAPEGIGWSAVDMGRLLVALRVLEERHPQYRDWIRGILSGWNLKGMAIGGELYGTAREGDELEYLQEGRIGYEQYAARAAALWALDTTSAISAARILDWRDVTGVEVAVDLRSASAFGAITPVVSEPYLLQALEMGLNGEASQLAERIYLAQEARYRDTGQLTAVSEDHIDQAPSFLYNSVFANGRDWGVVTEEGSFHPELRTISLKAAFGWDALYGTDYTALLRDTLEPLAGPTGWAAGLYEADGSANDIRTLNTNGILLEALHYKAFGPLLP